MATNNTKNTTESTTGAASTTENNDKSLFSKAKDALVNLKDQVKDLVSENDDNEIKGMPKKKFEATKTELESSLHFKHQEELNNDVAQLQNQSGLESSQNQSGVEFQNQNGANINMNYEEVNQQEFVKAPDVLLQQTKVVDDKKDEKQYAKLDKNEVHVLPTIHVKEKPVIVEKEIEFEKPVEIKQTIIHKEKPIIVEKPRIIEKNEHYRDATQHEVNNEKVVRESISEQDTGNRDEEALTNLRQDRIDAYSDTTPIIKHEKQNVKLDTDFREKPVKINEKEVLYQQPVEIERTNIENIKPKVNENITLNKEHVYEKTAPEVYKENPQVFEQERFFSQDTNATANINNNNVSTSNAADIAREENGQKKEIM